VRSDKVSLGTFVEPFYSAEVAKGGLRTLFTAVKASATITSCWTCGSAEKFLKAQPETTGRSSPTYVAVTRYYLANPEQAKRDFTGRGSSRTPLEIYLKNAD